MAREEVSLAEMYYQPDGDDPYGNTGEFSFAKLLQKRKKKKEYDENVEAFSELSNAASDGDDDGMPGADTGNYTGLGTGLMGPNIQTPPPPPPQQVKQTQVPAPSAPAFSGLSAQAATSDTDLSMPMGAESSQGRVENLKTVAQNALEFLGEDPSRSVDIYAPGGNTTLSHKDRQKIKAAFPDYSFWRNDSVEDFQEYLANQANQKEQPQGRSTRRGTR